MGTGKHATHNIGFHRCVSPTPPAAVTGGAPEDPLIVFAPPPLSRCARPPSPPHPGNLALKGPAASLWTVLGELPVGWSLSDDDTPDRIEDGWETGTTRREDPMPKKNGGGWVTGSTEERAVFRYSGGGDGRTGKAKDRPAEQDQDKDDDDNDDDDFWRDLGVQGCDQQLDPANCDAPGGASPGWSEGSVGSRGRAASGGRRSSASNGGRTPLRGRSRRGWWRRRRDQYVPA